MNLNNYIDILKSRLNQNIENYILEKDYILSLFLSNWAKEENLNLDKLIFKGGTLLTKEYLNYHRISEDLEFIHQDSNEIRSIRTKQRRGTQIKNRIIPIIDEIKKLADISNLEFETTRTNKKFIIQRNSRQLYIFKLYYKSQFTDFESHIKLEISFVEDFINKSKIEEIKNITDYFPLDEKDIKLLNHFLQKPTL